MEKLDVAQPCHRCHRPAVRAYDGKPTCVLCRAEEVREKLPQYRLDAWREQGVRWEPSHE